MNDQQTTNTENKPSVSDGMAESLSEQATATTNPTTEPVTEVSPSELANTSTKKVVLRNYTIAGLIIILMGGGLWLVLESQGRVQTNFLSAFTSRSAVATVNGVKITREAYEKNRRQVEESALQQNADVTDPAVVAEINKQAIETLVNTEILRQEADKLGIAVTSEDVQARYEAIVEQIGGPEVLVTRMAELDLTEEGLRGDIEGELVIQALFAEAIDLSAVEVTEEEIMQVYTQVSAEQGTEIALNDVREVIESNLRMSKEQALVTEYVQTLRTPAEVVINI